MVYHEEKSHDALGVLQMINVRKVQYSALSLAEKDQVFVLQDNGFFNRTTSLYEYGAFNVATGDYDGQYQGGGATRIFGETHKLETQPAFKYDSTTINQYDWWEGARQWLINTVPTGEAPHQSSSSGTMYDFNGRVRDWRIDDINARRIDYTVNANGQVMERNEVSVGEDVPDGPRPRQLFYYFNGMQVGDVGNKGALDVDYAETIRRRTADPDAGFFPWGQAASSNFGNGYEPINGQTAAATGYSYTVGAGDTLQSIAVALWGDAGLWYLIADANGLNGSETLVAGRTLSIPNKVINARNAADTFRVYDPNEGLGDIMPGQPKPPAGDEGCGKTAAIIVIIVAIVVTIATYGSTSEFAAGVIAEALTWMNVSAAATAAIAPVAGAVVGGAISGALGSLAGQAVGVALRIQSRIDWSAVAMASLSGAVGGALGAIPGLDGASIASTTARGMVGNVITQGVAVATGLQDQFSWTSVAVAGVTAGVGAAVGGWAQSTLKLDAGGIPNQVIAGTAGAIAGAATQSLIDGSDFGDNLQGALPGIVGATIGGLVMKGVAEPAGNSAASDEALRELGVAADELQGALGGISAAVAAGRSSQGQLYYSNGTGYTGIVRASYAEGDGGRITTGGPVSPKGGRGLWGWIRKTWHTATHPSEWLPALKRLTAPVWNPAAQPANESSRRPSIIELTSNDVAEIIVSGQRTAAEARDASVSFLHNVWNFLTPDQHEVRSRYAHRFHMDPNAGGFHVTQGAEASQNIWSPEELGRKQRMFVAERNYQSQKHVYAAQADPVEYAGNAIVGTSKALTLTVHDSMNGVVTAASTRGEVNGLLGLVAAGTNVLTQNLGMDPIFDIGGNPLAPGNVSFNTPDALRPSNAIQGDYIWGGRYVGLVGEMALGGSGLTSMATRAPGVRSVLVFEEGVGPNSADFVGPLIGKSGFRTSDEFAEAVGARYQGFVDNAYVAAQRLEASGLLTGNPNTRVGDYVDRISASRLAAYLRSEGITEGTDSLVQMNRWLRDPSGSGLYVRPDIRIPAAGRIYDATVGFKAYNNTQIVRFGQYSAGDRITIIRPSSLGSYSIVP